MVSLVLIFLFTFFIYVRMTPVATLTIDINPSFEIELNAFDRVVSITGLDDESNTFLEEINVKNKKIEDLVELFYEKGVEKGYFAENDAFMLVGVYSSDYQSELEIGDLLADFTKVTFLTVFQHLENNQLYFVSQDATTSVVTSNEGITPGDVAEGDMNSIEIPDVIYSDSGVSDTAKTQIAVSVSSIMGRTL